MHFVPSWKALFAHAAVQQPELKDFRALAHLGARNSRKAFHQNIGHFHYFLSEMYNSKY
jgi:hypothetical protein